MFGLEYLIALSKVCFKVAFAIVTAIPFWLAWNTITPIYYGQYIPEAYHELPYWHVVSAMIVIWVLCEQLGKITGLTPRLIYVNIDNSSESKGE